MKTCGKDTALCINCKFFVDSTDVNLGTCKRYPPPSLERNNVFPLVNRHNWCGEFKEKK